MWQALRRVQRRLRENHCPQRIWHLMGRSEHINAYENSSKAKAHLHIYVGSLLCAKAYVMHVIVRTIKDTGFRERGFAESQRSQRSFLWDNLMLWFWILTGPTSWVLYLVGLEWDLRFCISNYLLGMLMLLVFGPYLSFVIKGWAGSSSGRRIEEGTPSGMSPVLSVFSWPFPPKCPLPGVPLYCSWPVSCGFAKW